MANIDVIVPYLSGFGGMETVSKEVFSYYMKNDERINLRLIVPQGTENMEWLESFESDSIICNKSKITAIRKIKGIFFLIWYVLIQANNTDIIVGMSSKLVSILSTLRKVFQKQFLLVSWIHFSLYNEEAVKIHEIKKADFHLAISSGIKQQLVDAGINSQKIALIYNPIKKSNRVIQISDKKDVLNLCYIGRANLDGQKNIRELFYGLKKIEFSWKLNFFGSGADLNKIEELANELNIADNIIFNGWVNNPWKQIEETDYIVLTSKYEGLPMVLIESIERGIPCISADCPTGPADIINETNGFLYEPGNLEDLGDKFNLAYRNKLGFDRFQVKASADKFLERSYYKRLTTVFLNLLRGDCV